jgi:hypothetical protein
MADLSEEDKKLGEYIRAVFKESYSAALPALRRLEKMQEAFECRLPDTWSTYSQIYIPFVRTAVEQALPNVMNYMFPSSGMLSLSPRKPMPYSAVRPVEEYLEDLIVMKMDVKRNGLLTLKDALKFNVGYGIVETEIVTSPERVVNRVFSGGQTEKVVSMELGAPKEVLKYNYVNWRCVIPTPDGDCPEDVSGVFHLVPIREDVFRQMFDMDKEKGEGLLKGNPDAIIDYVRKNRMDLSYYPVAWVLEEFTGSNNILRNVQAMNQISRIAVSEKTPVIIPVLKCYFKNEHIWMAPDGTIIYHIKDDIQTLRCPIIKASPVPDGGNWYPVGDVEASRDAADAAIVFNNAIMDLLSYTLHPTTIVNRMMVQDANVGLEPHGRIEAYGKVGDAISFVNPPPFPNGIMNIGDNLETQFAVANGQPRQFQGQGTAGVVRGGGGAFESFLQTTQARSKLACAVLETGWLRTVVEHTLILAQVIGQNDTYIARDDTKESFVEKTITANELRNAFDVNIVLDDKFRKTPADRALDLQIYAGVIKGNPRFDWQAADEWIIGDRELARRLRASPDVMQAQQQMLQSAQDQEAAKQKAGQTQGEQAMMGGASQAGGV